MLPVMLRSRHVLVENIKSLETQLTELQGRLNVIVDWISSQYYEFLGIPETVVIALGGYNIKPSSVSAVSVVTTTKKNKSFRAKVSSHLGTQKTKDKRVKGQEQSNTDETGHQIQSNNPVVRLDKLSLQDIEILADIHGITNLHFIETVYSKINCLENSNSLFCPICNRRFKLRIQLEKHKLDCQPNNSAIIYNESSQMKRREINLTATNEESVFGDVLTFTPISNEENDSGSEYDPLGDAHSNESCEEDISGNVAEKRSGDDLGVEFAIKDEIDIKEETVEDDIFISQDTNTTERLPQQKEKSLAHLLRSRKKFGDIVHKQTVENKSEGHKYIIINLCEYEKLVASKGRGQRSLSCVVCSKMFSTMQLVTRHEIGLHLTEEDRSVYVNWRRSEETEKMKSYSFICEICGRPCKTLCLLYRHKNSHVSSEVITEVHENGCSLYRCLNCDSLFPEKQKCIIHVARNCTNEKQETNVSDILMLQAAAKSCDGMNKKILNLSEYEKLLASMEPRSLSCVVCSKMFLTMQTVTRHEISLHLTEEDRSIYRNRRRSLEMEKRKNYSFICEICGRPCKTLSLLYRHKNSHVSSEVLTESDVDGHPNYRCENCDSIFSEKQNCIIHVVRFCTNEKQLEAQLTQDHKKSTDIKLNKLENGKYKKSKKVLQCEECGWITGSSCSLRSHLVTHKGERNFICNQCGERFVRKQTLTHHEIAIHTIERPHKCQYCEKTFVLQSVKAKHEKKHLGVLAISCNICGFTFTCMSNLKKHITGVHENRRPHKCHLCEKSFKTSTARNYHVKTHNNPNGRKRGLNKDIDHLKAAAKRRHCTMLKDPRIPLLNSAVDSIETPV